MLSHSGGDAALRDEVRRHLVRRCNEYIVAATRAATDARRQRVRHSADAVSTGIGGCRTPSTSTTAYVLMSSAMPARFVGAYR